MKENGKHVYDVVYEERTVDKFRVYISKDFWHRIGVEDGDKVEVSVWELFNEIRIRKKKGV